MSQAYQQMILDEDSKQYVTISTHKGLFRYNRLPFGVSSAPGIFQRTMENLLQNISHTVVRVDDVLVSGRDDADHIRNLEEVLSRVSAAGVHLNKDKCEFMAPRVTFCGQVINQEGIQPMKEKVSAVVEAPRPTSVSQLKSYLGLLNFYHRFLPKLSSVLAPLHKLLQSGVKWSWDKQQEDIKATTTVFGSASSL